MLKNKNVTIVLIFLVALLLIVSVVVVFNKRIKQIETTQEKQSLDR